jgi:Integral membrane protein (intg_mem_TP0381)
MERLISAEHLTTLGVIAISMAALVTAARLRPGPWTVVAGRTLALVILINECGWWVWLAGQHMWSASYALPLQLCDVVAFAAAGALWFRHPLLVELTYFWGLAGTANALISPDLPDHFPSYLFFQYFIAHAAIVAAALFLVIGLRIAPRPRRRAARPRADAGACGARRRRERCHRRQLHVPAAHTWRAQPSRPHGAVALVHRRGQRPRARDLLLPRPPLRDQQPPAIARARRRSSSRDSAMTNGSFLSDPEKETLKVVCDALVPSIHGAGTDLGGLLSRAASELFRPHQESTRCSR